MKLDKFIGFRLKDAMKQLEKLNINKYVFETTKEPRRESTPISPDLRILRIVEKLDGAVCILLCDEN